MKMTLNLVFCSLLFVLTACGTTVVEPSQPDSVDKPVPVVTKPHAEIDNFVAAVAESTMEVLSKGLKSCKGDPQKKINSNNVAWFSFADGVQRFHLLPRGKAVDSGATWCPMTGNFPVTYSTVCQGDLITVTPQMMASSSLYEVLLEKVGNLDTVSNGVRMLISCKPEGTTPNLYHYTAYFFFKPEPEWRGLKNRIPDPKNPAHKINGLLHKFDFLIGRTN